MYNNPGYSDGPGVIAPFVRRVREGVAKRNFQTDEPREAARAIVTLAQSTVGVEREINRSLDDIIELYQGFAVALVR